MGMWTVPIAFKPINGWVDYMLIGLDGRVAFVDAKTTEQDTFIYSLINRGQLGFLRSVGDRVPAGYVIYFRGEIQRVVYYHFDVLMACKPRGSLAPADGIDLGPPSNFDVHKIFLAKLPEL